MRYSFTRVDPNRPTGVSPLAIETEEVFTEEEVRRNVLTAKLNQQIRPSFAAVATVVARCALGCRECVAHLLPACFDP